MKTISILGCGWFGLPFAKQLVELNYLVKGSTTSIDKLEILEQTRIKPYLLNFSTENTVDSKDFFEADVLLICIPPKRNSAELFNYPSKINLILNLAEHKTKHVILISSTSVYGDVNASVDENTIPIPDTASGKLLLETEQNFLNKGNFTKTIIRFAGLIGPDRNPGRFFAGKTNVPNGLTPVNLIQQQDAIGIALAIIEQEKFGKIYNACNPNHPSRIDFYTEASKKSGFELPQFLTEKNAWKTVDSVNVAKYLAYEFKGKI